MADISFDGINIDAEAVREKLAEHDAGRKVRRTPHGAEVSEGPHESNKSLKGYQYLQPEFLARVSVDLQLINNNRGAVWLQHSNTSGSYGTPLYIEDLRRLIEACQAALDYVE